MISNDSAAPIQRETPLCDAKADAAEAPVLNPRSPIEVAPGGTGPINDPGATDTKPPGYDDLEHFV